MGRNNFDGIAWNLVILAIVGLICVTVSHGQTPEEAAKNTTAWLGEGKLTSPVEGQVRADKVRVRSGPGLNYYVCGALALDSKVVVYEERAGWLKIEPPKGCFSLIAAKYVKKSAGEWGEVTGSMVRVRAGASESKQNYQVQCKLNKGDGVHILGKVTSVVDAEKLSFYKIKPPKGKALFWVYAKYIGPVTLYKDEPAVEPEDIVETMTVPDIEKALEIPDTIKVPASQDRTEFENLAEALKIEFRRPVAERRLAEHLAKYMGFSAKTKSESLRKLSQSHIKEIRQHMDIQTALERSSNIKESYTES